MEIKKVRFFVKPRLVFTKDEMQTLRKACHILEQAEYKLLQHPKKVFGHTDLADIDFDLKQLYGKYDILAIILMPCTDDD